MKWKRGKIKFDDGSTYPAELLVNSEGQIWNVKVIKDNNVVEEVDVNRFANDLGKKVEDIYPYSFEIE